MTILRGYLPDGSLQFTSNSLGTVVNGPLECLGDGNFLINGVRAYQQFYLELPISSTAAIRAITTYTTYVAGLTRGYGCAIASPDAKHVAQILYVNTGTPVYYYAFHSLSTNTTEVLTSIATAGNIATAITATDKTVFIGFYTSSSGVNAIRGYDVLSGEFKRGDSWTVTTLPDDMTTDGTYIWTLTAGLVEQQLLEPNKARVVIQSWTPSGATTPLGIATDGKLIYIFSAS